MVLNRQNIFDWWQLRNYQAPASISRLAEQDTMTDYARKILYVNQTEISAKSAFAEQCPNNGGEQTIVLGCYHSKQAGIFLLGVSDPRLDGVQQVTAAHEMLHGAYDRLSSSERRKVDDMLVNYYQNRLTDQRIINTMKAYKKTEPNDLVNEMHSIFGTEILNLPAELEQYYKRYFINRTQVVKYSERYQSEFTSRQAEVARYDASLASLKQQINNMEADLKVRQGELQERQAALNDLRSGNNIDQYNAGVPGYNSLINSYNAEADQVKELVAQYNDLVGKRNATAFEKDQLTKELKSDVAPAER